MTSRLSRLKASIEKLERTLVHSWSPNGSAAKPVTSWDAFIADRKLEEWKNEDPEVRFGLLTELLSYPLTLVSQLDRIQTPSNITVHVVGARAEATLPVIYWAQALKELPRDGLKLCFSGPDIPQKLNGLNDSLNVGGKTLLRSFANDVYKPGEQIPDVFVLFNPGLAHAKYKKGWLPTLKSIAKTNKPIVITGFHSVDANNDQQLVKSMAAFEGRNITSPANNPFASTKEFEDGLSGRVARANLFAWSVN